MEIHRMRKKKAYTNTYDIYKENVPAARQNKMLITNVKGRDNRSFVLFQIVALIMNVSVKY